MNAAERVFATVAGNAVDRRPVTPVLSLYGAKLTGCPLEKYYSDPIAYALGQVAVRDLFEPDVLFTPFQFAAIGAAFGSQIRFYADQPPNVKRPAIESAREWERIVLPDPDTHPRLTYIREAVREMVARFGTETPVAVPFPALIDFPALIMGMDGWMETVLFDPDCARRIMEALTPLFVRLVNGFFADGAAFVALPCGFWSPSVVPRAIVKSLMRPAMGNAMAQLRGPVVLHHCGAAILEHLDLFVGLSPAIGIVVETGEDLVRARQIVGPDPILFNGPAAANMPEMTAPQLEGECRALLENRRHDPRFVLCNCGPDVPWSTPPENIHALRQAAHDFGGFQP